MHRASHESNLAYGMLRRAALNPERIALIFEEEKISYGQLAERVRRQATLLKEAGVCAGDRVAYLGFNHPAFFETLFAANTLGAIFVPLNFRLTAEELTFIINDAGVHTVIAGPAHRAVLDTCRSDVGVARWIGIEGATEGWDTLDELAAAASPIFDVAVSDAEETAVIMYTSGTTGLPKGAMLTHANLWWNNVNTLMVGDYTSDEVSLVFAPLFHIGGLNVTTLVVMQRGGHVILHRHFDPVAAIEAIEVHRVTSLFGVPAMFLVMSQQPQFDTADLSSIKITICGGAPVPEPLMHRYEGVGVPFQQGYGLTETSPSLTRLPKQYRTTKLGSAGQAAFFTELKLMAIDGSTVTEPFANGEICARGPNIMKGYWNRPEATAEAIDSDGWFRTGDAGYVDEDGFLFVVDRVKDMVISGGENVYPAEVESVLLGHPAITQVAVIGTPSQRWGEAVCAVASLDAGAELSLDELRTFAGQSLARYKLPTRLEVIDEIPHNASGKVLKRDLRTRFDAEVD